VGLWAEAALEISGHLPGRALVSRRNQGIRSRGSQIWWLVQRMDQWRGLLDEVRLKKQNIPEAHMRPRECGHAYQEVEALSTGFRQGKAKLYCLVLRRHNDSRADELSQTLLEE